MAPKGNKGMTYFKRKALAEKMYGTAAVRPQDILKTFMFQRRRVNYGITSSIYHPQRHEVEEWVPSRDILRPYTSNPIDGFVYVDTDSTFDKLCADLQASYAVALDTEGHDEHSYSGMISLIQLATKNNVYVLDPFLLHKRIYEELRPLLQDRKRIIIVHGGDNDFLWMKRDFDIHIVGAIDLQTYHYLKQGGNMISYDELVKYYIQVDISDGSKKFAQLADWTKRPLSPELLYYASNDVRYLMEVWKHILNNEDVARIEKAIVATKKKLLSSCGIKKFKTAAEELKASRKFQNLSPTQMNLYELLWEWRNQHAAKVDENPKHLISTQVLVYLAKNPPSTEERVQEAFNGKVPDIIGKGTKTIMRLVKEGRPYLEKILPTVVKPVMQRTHVFSQIVPETPRSIMMSIQS